MKTKAILFADGDAQKLQPFKGDTLFKEKLQESDYEETKAKHVSESLSLNAGETNDVITINKQQVSILVFEDGSVYDVSKGFRTVVSENIQKEIDSVLEAEKLEVKKLEAKKAAEAKAIADKKVTDEKPVKVKVVKEVKPAVEK